MKKSLFTSLFVLASLASPVQAANLFKDCGLGQWIAGGTWNGGLAITTNVTWDLGTTATTSHVSSPGSCSGPSFAAAKFINESYPSLEQETVQGSGEHLVAVMDILGCEQSVQPAVSKAIRSDFAEQVSKANYSTLDDSAKAESYYNIVIKHSSTQCNIS